MLSDRMITTNQFMTNETKFYSVVLTAKDDYEGEDKYILRYFHEITSQVEGYSVQINPETCPNLFRVMDDVVDSEYAVFVLVVPSSSPITQEEFTRFINASSKFHGLDRFIISKYIFASNVQQEALSDLLIEDLEDNVEDFENEYVDEDELQLKLLENYKPPKNKKFN